MTMTHIIDCDALIPENCQHTDGVFCPTTHVRCNLCGKDLHEPLAQENLNKCGTFLFGECLVMVGLEVGWHLIISHPSRYPSYDEIKSARYKFIPDEVTMAMLFPPKDEFVNVSSNCFHLLQVPNDH